MNTSSSSLSTIVSRMVSSGLIEKQDFCPYDGVAEKKDLRKVYFKITEDGDYELKRIVSLMIEEMLSIYEELEQRHQQILTQGVGLLYDSLPEEMIQRIDFSEIYQNQQENSQSIAVITKLFKFNFATAHIVTKAFSTLNKNGRNTFSISERQFGILQYMHYLKVSRIKELKDHLKVSDSTLSLLLSKLVKENYIQRHLPKEGEDGRGKYFCITDKGIEIMEMVGKSVEEEFKSYFCGLDKEKQIALYQGILIIEELFDTLFPSGNEIHEK